MTTTTDSRIALDRFASRGEAAKARSIIAAALKAGFRVSVHDGEEWTLKQSNGEAFILEALCTTGEDRIRLRKDGEFVASLWLIYGNAHDGSELIADYSYDEEGPFMAAMGHVL